VIGSITDADLASRRTAAAIVGGCALVASALPAQRATAIAPMEALRAE
jgi:ABC-type antimicrobial peptide transport system permease subunit